MTGDEPIRRHRSATGRGMLLDVPAATAGWRFVSFRVLSIAPGESVAGDSGGEELVVVPLIGAGWIGFGGAEHALARRDVFREKPGIAYLPPGTAWTIAAADGTPAGGSSGLEVAIGGAPATGRYPARFFEPGELATFSRGGANVSRGVTVTFDPSFPSERLIAYEIVTPSGNWSSFPPHRHDGREGTSYHEETYYYRLDPVDGFAIQRLYTRDTDLDVSIAAGHGDLVLVHEGYHAVAAAPGTNVYYLNFLAGEDKPVVQQNDPAYAWIADDWTGRPVPIPIE